MATYRRRCNEERARRSRKHAQYQTMLDVARTALSRMDETSNDRHERVRYMNMHNQIRYLMRKCANTED